MEIKKLEEMPKEITSLFLQVVVMPNGEIIHEGKTIKITNDPKFLFKCVLQ